MSISYFNMISALEISIHGIILISYFLLSDGLSASISPLDPRVEVNSSATFNCTTSVSRIPVGVKWRIKNYIGSDWRITITKDCLKLGDLPFPYTCSCDCCDKILFSLTIEKVTIHFHKVPVICEIYYSDPPDSVSEEAIIQVVVPVSHVRLNILGSETVHEKSNVTFVCNTTDSLPPAAIRWYRTNELSVVELSNADNNVKIISSKVTGDDNLISTVETLTYNVNRSINGWKVYCIATNFQNKIVRSDKVSLSIIYPPDLPVIQRFTNGSTHKIVETFPANLSCSAKGGNPLGKLKWLCNNVDTKSSENTDTDNEIVTSNLLWTAARNRWSTCTCKLDHELSKAFVSVNIDVLYSPDVPRVHIQYENDDENVTSVAKLIEHKSYKLYCSADGNPNPTMYVWKKPQQIHNITSSNGFLDLNNVTRIQNGIYSCLVQNIMAPTFGESIIGVNDTSVNVDILYQPTIAVLKNQDLPEGSSLNVTCKAVSANPQKTEVLWTRGEHGWNRSSSPLIMENISRDDANNYTCGLTNNMTPTVGPKERGYANRTFNLNVWYRASVTIFKVNGDKIGNQTVANESTRVVFTCDVDSNPSSTINLITPNSTKFDFSNTNIIEYSYHLSSCLDSGVYICSGSNEYNNGQPGIAHLDLLVNCRPMAHYPIEEDVRSELYVPVTLQFTTISYPRPDFTWETWANESWTQITNDSMFCFSSSGMESNLTVKNFTSTTIKYFRLVVENFVGKLIQNYTLQPFGRPDTPTELDHIPTLLTESSVTLQWKPGFNGGPKQTFHVLYTSNNEGAWKNISLTDTGETEINFTITNLTSDTNYTFRIYAANIKGMSRSLTLHVQTKARGEKTSERFESSTGLIAGSTSGALVIAALVLIGIIFYRKRYKRKSDKVNETAREVMPYEELTDMNSTVGGETPYTNLSLYEAIRQDKDRGMNDKTENTYEQLRPGSPTSAAVGEKDFEELKTDRDETGSSIPIYTNLKL